MLNEWNNARPQNYTNKLALYFSSQICYLCRHLLIWELPLFLICWRKSIPLTSRKKIFPTTSSSLVNEPKTWPVSHRNSSLNQLLRNVEPTESKVIFSYFSIWFRWSSVDWLSSLFRYIWQKRTWTLLTLMWIRIVLLQQQLHLRSKYNQHLSVRKANRNRKRNEKHFQMFEFLFTEKLKFEANNFEEPFVYLVRLQ